MFVLKLTGIQKCLNGKIYLKKALLLKIVYASQWHRYYRRGRVKGRGG